jgi:Kef-type K+ transport system membrane component KefB
MPSSQLSVYFFAQAAVIVLASQLVGRLAQRVGQPQVVGEMIAGVLLGPSLFGMLLPHWQQALFPKPTMGMLYVAAQLGVGLYMFLVGTEFRADHFRARARSAMSVSLAGIVAPFALAFALTPWLHTIPGLFAEKVRLYEASLFLGAAIGGGAAFALFMIFAGGKLLRRLAAGLNPHTPLPTSVLATVMVLFSLCAFAMDAIGIHAVFGGFLLGVALPRGPLTEKLRDMLQPFVVVFLLPMFFTYSGLNTRLDMLMDPAIMLAAVVRRQGHRMLGGRARQWRAFRRRNGDRRADECARFDGTDHHQHRTRGGRDPARTVFDPRADGRAQHADGHAALQLDRAPQCGAALGYRALAGGSAGLE